MDDQGDVRPSALPVGLVTAERRGTTILYAVADAAIFELLDVARRIHNSRLSSTVDLLRLVEDEAGVSEDEA